MKYSNQEVIKLVERSRREKLKLTHITDRSKLSVEDKVKIGLCKRFVQFAESNGLLLKDVARLIDIPVPRISEIVNYKITKFSVDQLLKNLSRLSAHDPRIREYLLFLEQAIEVPTLSVAQTRRLTRDLRSACP